MSENKFDKLTDKDIEEVSGGKTEEKSQNTGDLALGRCYCGYTEDLKGVTSKKMFMNVGLKKEWKCPQCGRNNVERDFKWTKIFAFK